MFTKKRGEIVSILLVTMPWNSLDFPSVQLGILKSVVDKELPEENCENLYANLLWAEFLYQKSEGRVDRSTEYPLVADGTFSIGVGEWIFTPALYGEEYKREEYVQFMTEYSTLSPEDIKVVEWMYDQSQSFVELLMDEYFDTEYSIVGFTSSFMQNVPSLALARLIKQKYPNTTIIFGGANCDGEQGEALHRNFEFIDFVVRGEGELVLPQLIRKVLYEDNPTFYDVKSLCYRDGNGKSCSNPIQAHAIDLAEVPLPFYDDYFEIVQHLEVSENIKPQLALETSRGCWWGAKHQCTFCGLNGSLIEFRSHPADRAYHMIVDMVEKYKTLDLLMVDNIMDLSYMNELLPRLKELPWDLNIFFEVKANLIEDNIRLFDESGVKSIQPGIESLSTEVLKLMDKGITGIQNIQLLKYCEKHSVTLTWNVLYGFPGEKWEFYDIEKMKFLTHFQAPGAAIRINLERFSPYFEKPELGLKPTAPAKFYSLVYKLPVEELMDLAYVFESEVAGLDETEAEQLRLFIDEWQKSYTVVVFNYSQSLDGMLHFFDTRNVASQREFTLSDPLHIAIHDELNIALNIKGLRKRLIERMDDERLDVASAYLQNWMDEMVIKGVFYEENGKYLALAIPYDRQRIRENRYIHPTQEEVLGV